MLSIGGNGSSHFKYAGTDQSVPALSFVGFCAYFSIGTPTELPHSVQLPS